VHGEAALEQRQRDAAGPDPELQDGATPARNSAARSVFVGSRGQSSYTSAMRSP